MRAILFSLSIFMFCIFQSCKDPDIKPEDEDKFRTVLVYLAANNSLELEAYKNMDQMENALGDIDGNLIVYAKLPGNKPSLYHIYKKEGEKARKVKIKDYEPHNSSDPITMRLVLEDVRNLFPAKTFGLVLWSHATGWIPSSNGNIKLKSFGDDGGSQMDVKELHSALPYTFDFILFDACSMASVEVLYEIKEKAKYFIASPGEVIANGMPYDKITNDLFSPDVNAYRLLAEKYHAHYDNLSGLHRSATISVIDASKLQDVASETKHIILSQQPLHTDYNRNHIQRMDFDRIGNPLIAFDFLDFMEQNYSHVASYRNLQSTLEKAVVFKANTPSFNGFTIDKNSGLTCYIPHPDNEETVHTYYRTLKWYTDSGFDKLL
ncbi:clostripain-related cysteine peptidase [Sphingobacterium corticibacterium]|uniref:Clostripain n=1 Tax=Sphingobacterium corticibacterium TaxID=2484746 RepID=A0A4Q6XRC8_9SPHI|nr:clostripain-related cysteine peptidase [Sphingobacterium corticibacterium]RZF62491.1 clostripain [Sphingobacterium corticibacterium]